MFVQVCAHRYVHRGADFRWGNGICYSLTQYLDYNRTYEPCRNRLVDLAHEQFGIQKIEQLVQICWINLYLYIYIFFLRFLSSWNKWRDIEEFWDSYRLTRTIHLEGHNICKQHSVKFGFVLFLNVFGLLLGVTFFLFCFFSN